MSDEKFSAKFIRDELNYNPHTGDFFRKRTRSNKVKVGEKAGGVDVKGYVVIRVMGKNYKAHRLAWLHYYGKWPESEIDHVNHIRSDNRIENLRDVSRSVNQHNRRKVKGWYRDGKKYRAQIRVNNVRQDLGLYETKLEAHTAYLKAKSEMKARKGE